MRRHPKYKADNTEVWIGTVTVHPLVGCELVGPTEGAIVNIVTPSRTVDQFNARVQTLCDAYHLRIVRLEGQEPIRQRFPGLDMSMEMEVLANEVRGTNQIRFTTFHKYPLDSENEAEV